MSDDGEHMIDEINEEDILEVIELNDNDVVADEVGHIGLDEDANDDDSGDDEDMEEAEGAGVEIKDDAELVFKKHTDSVFSVNLDPKSCDLAVSGGQDDMAYVWRVSTGEIILECSGHKDSVTCTGFSYDGVYVATADLSGLVKVWKLETKKEVWSFECSDAEWLQWHPGAHVLMLGTVDGDVWMWKIPSGDCRTFQGPGCTASCGKILPDGKRSCVGYDNGSVKLWDLKSATVEHTVAGHEGHTSSVICLDCNHDNSLVLSGSTDVTAKIISCNNGKVLGTLNCNRGPGDGGGAEDSVESVGFSNVQNFAAAGTVTGDLSIWDIPTLTCRNRCQHQAGIVKLRWAQDAPLVYTCSLDGVVRLWDCRNGKSVSQWTGHTDAVLDFDISRDSNLIVTGSEDKTARVFSLSSPDR